MNRWHIRKDSFPVDCPWTLYRDNAELIDPNTDLACIEGGMWPTWREALQALDVALRLDFHIIEETPV